MVFTVSTGWNTVSNTELAIIYSGKLAPLAHNKVLKFTPKNYTAFNKAPLKYPYLNPPFTTSPKVPIVFTGKKNLYFKTEYAYLIAITLSIPLNKVNLKILSLAKSKISGSSVHLFYKERYLLLI